MKLLRQSILNDYETCPYMAYVNWGDVGSIGVKDTEDVKNKYAEIGILFHEVMEYAGLENMKGKKVTEEELHELIDSKIAVIDKELFVSEEEIENYRTSLHEQLEWTYIEAMVNLVTPLAVEYNFELEALLDDCIPFRGTIDRIMGDTSKKSIVLEDYKTGRVYTKKELESNMQAGLYSLAFYKINGYLPKEFVFYFTKFRKKKVIKITPEFLKKSTERILSNWYSIKNNDFAPNDKNKFFCRNFCNAKDNCPKFKKKTGWNNIGYDNESEYVISNA